MKIILVHGPEASGKTTQINKIIKGGKVNYIENFAGGNLKEFIGAAEVEFIVTTLDRPLQDLQGELLAVCNTDEVNIRFPYAAVATTMKMPTIIIESQFKVDTNDIHHLSVAYGIIFEFVEINLFPKGLGLYNDFEPIRVWAENKGIYKSGDLKSQALKLMEEAGELAKAILNDDVPEIEDALGDCTVVLVSVAELARLKYKKHITLENCTNLAYDVIAQRKGSMKNGTFVKEN